MAVPVFRQLDIEPAEFTAAGVGIPTRAPCRPRRIDLLAQLLGGPFLAAFNAGLYGLRDACPKDVEAVWLVAVERWSMLGESTP
jgi:hypothetical protein